MLSTSLLILSTNVIHIIINIINKCYPHHYIHYRQMLSKFLLILSTNVANITTTIINKSYQHCN